MLSLTDIIDKSLLHSGPQYLPTELTHRSVADVVDPTVEDGSARRHHGDVGPEVRVKVGAGGGGLGEGTPVQHHPVHAVDPNVLLPGVQSSPPVPGVPPARAYEGEADQVQGDKLPDCRSHQV